MDINSNQQTTTPYIQSQEEYIPISNFFKPKKYQKYRTALRNRQLYYIEQLLNDTAQRILTWQQIAHTTKQKKGRISHWYQSIKDIICAQNSNVIDITIDTPNPFRSIQLNINQLKNPNKWCATLINNNLTIIKKQRKSSLHTIIARHYIQNNHSTLLTPCTGCSINEPHIRRPQNTQPQCYFQIQRQQLVDIQVDRTINNHNNTSQVQLKLQSTPNSIQLAVTNLTVPTISNQQNPQIIIDPITDTKQYL